MENYEENKIDLIKYLDSFVRSCLSLKKYIILIILGCVLLFEGKTLLTFQKTYSSKAVFIPTMSEQQDFYQVNDGSKELVERFTNLMTGPIMNKVITESLHTTTIPGNILVSLIPNTNLIELKVVSTNAEDAYNVVNSIINNYDKATNNIMDDVKLFVLDNPKLVYVPDSEPNYLKTGIKGGLVGFALSFVLVCLYALFRKTINTSDDIRERVHLHTIASIPFIHSSGLKETDVTSLVLINPRMQYPFKKSFTDICLRIEKENKDKNSKVFMITSTLPNEGKSIVSTNAAISLADKGYKVILVDIDLRNPSIKKILGEESVNDLASYLNHKFKISDIIMKSQKYPMDVIFGDHPVDDASELIGTDTFKELISELKEVYDFVILDVPPLHMMEDASLVAKHADAGLVVIKQDYAKDYEIMEAVDELNNNIPYTIGAILNQVKPSLFDEETSKYGYGYGYGSHYGYGYGYGKK